MERMERATPNQNITQGRDMASQGWTPSDVRRFVRTLKFPRAAAQELIAGYRGTFSQA